MKVIKGMGSLICGIIGSALEQIVKLLCFLAGIIYMVIGICCIYCFLNQLWLSLGICIVVALAVFIFLLILLFVASQLKSI